MSMTCPDVAKRLPQFLDDLLSEPEYRDVRAHLTSCAGCQQYAGSVGSLTHAIILLGKIQVPADLGETIRFQFAKRPDAVRTQPVKPRRGVPAAVLLAAMLVLLGGVVLWRTRGSTLSRPEADPPVSITARLERPQHSASDAVVYAQLQAMASALGVEGADSPSASYQWTVSYAGEAQRLQLFDALRALDVRREYEASELLVLSLSAGQLRQLLDVLRRIPLQVTAPGERLEPPEDEPPDRTLQLWIHLRGA